MDDEKSPSATGTPRRVDTVQSEDDAAGPRSTSTSSAESSKRFKNLRENGALRRIYEVVTYTPRRCRWDPEDPPKFSMGLNLLFGFVSYAYSTLTS